MKTALEMLRDFEHAKPATANPEPQPKILPDDPERLSNNLSTWPPLSRYLVAALERRGLTRTQAVKDVRWAMRQATGEAP